MNDHLLAHRAPNVSCHPFPTGSEFLGQVQYTAKVWLPAKVQRSQACMKALIQCARFFRPLGNQLRCSTGAVGIDDCSPGCCTHSLHRLWCARRWSRGWRWIPAAASSACPRAVCLGRCLTGIRQLACAGRRGDDAQQVEVGGLGTAQAYCRMLAPRSREAAGKRYMLMAMVRLVSRGEE